MSKGITKLTAASEQMSESGVLAIEVKELCKSFKDFRAVDNLTLSWCLRFLRWSLLVWVYSQCGEGLRVDSSEDLIH